MNKTNIPVTAGQPANNPISRRRFLQRAAAAGVAGLAFPYVAPKSWAGTNGPALRVAIIGVGGIGLRHAEETERLGAVCPCYAEVDTRRADNVLSRWPDSRGFRDYRKMFDKMNREFDAVIIATPDHHHFPASMLALIHDKHCFTQKPLTHTIGEARILAEAAASKRLATQMGNQGHANMGNRMIHGWVTSGAIGDIVEAHCWTNRPLWPQGLDTPTTEADIPPELDWDVFLGPAPYRPFAKEPSNHFGGVYHPFNWRGWWDFGGGALGDMACHTMDGLYLCLHPAQPSSFELVHTTGFNGDSFPRQSIIRLNFTSDDGQREIPVNWYSGGLQPARPEGLEDDEEMQSSGALIVGTRASIYAPGYYGDSPRIIPDEMRREIGRPEQMREPSPGHAEEWFMACRGEKPIDFPKANFSYSGPFTEVVNLGVLAHQLNQGERAKWDSKKLEVPNRPDLNRFINKPYRDGWYFEL